jgi:cell division septum initiation protein DivIVA
VTKKLLKYVGTLCNLIKDQKAKIEQLQSKVSDLSKQIDSINNTELTWSNIVEGKKQSEQTQVMIANVNKELIEKARIENNVILSGVGDHGDDHDKNVVNEVLEVLSLDRNNDVKSKRRVKASRNTNSDEKKLDMIVVEFKNETAQMTALRNAMNLKSSNLSKVFKP